MKYNSLKHVAVITKEWLIMVQRMLDPFEVALNLSGIPMSIVHPHSPGRITYTSCRLWYSEAPAEITGAGYKSTPVTIEPTDTLITGTFPVSACVLGRKRPVKDEVAKAITVDDWICIWEVRPFGRHALQEQLIVPANAGLETETYRVKAIRALWLIDVLKVNNSPAWKETIANIFSDVCLNEPPDPFMRQLLLLS